MGDRWDAVTADPASLPESLEHSDQRPRDHHQGVERGWRIQPRHSHNTEQMAPSAAFSTQMLIKLAPTIGPQDFNALFRTSQRLGDVTYKCLDWNLSAEIEVVNSDHLVNIP